jgi:hypothetical protein
LLRFRHAGRTAPCAPQQARHTARETQVFGRDLYRTSSSPARLQAMREARMPSLFLSRWTAVRALAALLALAAVPAQAQILLPGASQPAPSAPGGVQGVPVPAKPKPKPQPPKAAADASIDGRTLYLNGSKGRLTVERRDKDGLTVRLIAVGYKMSAPSESCGLDLGAGQPITLRAAGRPEGVGRYSLGIPGCDVSFDTLDGGLLAVAPGGACEFREGDCKVDLHGVWGPPPSVIEGDAAAIEKDRGRADKAVREAYKTLIKSVPKTDKAGVRKVAAEQAGFTSEREIMCRDYARESALGYCATRFTEYRAASLAVRLGKAPPPGPDDQPKPRPKPKPKPAIVPSPGQLY